MYKLIAVPYKFYPQVQFIVDYLRSKFNIIEYNKMELSLKDIEGNKYFLFNDPNKVRGFEFIRMEYDPSFDYDSELIETIKSRISI